jgi:hypothetical protein
MLHIILREIIYSYRMIREKWKFYVKVQVIRQNYVHTEDELTTI